MAQSVKHLTVSGHNLMICEFELWVELCVDSAEPALDSVSLSLSAPLLPVHLLSHSLSLSLSLSKINSKKKIFLTCSGVLFFLLIKFLLLQPNQGLCTIRYVYWLRE